MHRKVKQGIALFLTFIIALSIPFSALAFQPPVDLVSPSVMIVNIDTGHVLYEKNADEKMPAGILTQVMTEILAVESIKDTQNTQITAESKLFDLFNGKATYTADIQRGETLSAYEMMMALFIQNSYEAAAALAYHVGGDSMSKFVSMMNDKAAEIGAENTHFTNAYGGDNDDQYTTARDMAAIARYALQVEGFGELSGKKAYTLPPYKDRNRPLNAINLMLLNGSSYYNKSVTGMKTGTTAGSDRCLIATAESKGYHYMIVILGAPIADANGTSYSSNIALTEANTLFNWVFNDFSLCTIVTGGSVVANVEVKLSMNTSNLALAPKESFVTLIPSQANASAVQIKSDIPKYIKAPIAKGDTVGMMRFYLEGEEIGSVDLVATEDVSMNQFLFVMDLLDMVFSSIWFKIFLGLVIACLITYLVVVIRINLKNKKHNKIIRDHKKKRRH